MTVSGAPETALIEPPFCRPLPPAGNGHSTASCGIVSTNLGIVRPTRLFCGFPLPPQTHPLHLYKPGLSPSNDHALSLPFFPPDLPRPLHCPLSKMPCYRTIALFQYSAVHSLLFPLFSYGVADRSSGRLRR